MTRAPYLPALLVATGLVAQTAPQAPAAQPQNAEKLTLQEAIQTALKNNLQVSIAEQNRELAKGNLLFNEGSFDWLLSASANVSKTKDFVTTFNQGESTTTRRNLTVGLNKPFEWGGNVNVSYAPFYSLTTSQTPSPLNSTYPYDGNFNATYTQHLLSGFGKKASSTQLIVARNGAKAADFQFQQSVIALVAQVESQYWDVVFARENLDNKQQSLALAQKQLKENQIRVEVGTLAPIEVTSAEATVAQREQDIIAAEAQLKNAVDALIRALYPVEAQPAALMAADEPAVGPLPLDEPAAEQRALENRVEMKSAELDLESKKIQEDAAKNRLLPQLDLSLGYAGNAASSDRLSPVNSDLTDFKYPGYNVGLTFSIPIMNKAARGNLAQARANTRQSELSKRDLELGIRLQVRQAYRNVEAAAKGVAAAEKTRIFQEKTLEAEQKKFENGMSTNFFVLQRQNDLDTAKANELQARINYAKAVTALEQATGNLLQARNLEIR
ncbi:MAG TPA: TolC family protein [Holophagaceae bacterium]|nr:TolC family protein [Holophagaceae bacterium]